MNKRNIIALVLFIIIIAIIIGAYGRNLPLALAACIVLFVIAFVLADRLVRVSFIVLLFGVAAFFAIYAIVPVYLNSSELLNFTISQGWQITISVILALVTVAIALLALFYIASEWILGLSGYMGVTGKLATKTLFTSITGTQYPYVIVSDGEPTIASRGSILTKFGGPGLVITKPQNAAVLEWGGRVTQIVGPGLFLTRMFETLKQPVDLRPQKGAFPIEEIRTREGIPLRFTVRFSYRIETLEDERERNRIPNPPQIEILYPGALPGAPRYSRNAVGRAIYHAGGEGWKKETEHAIKAALYDVIEAIGIEDIFGAVTGPLVDLPSDTLRALADEARLRSWARAAQWGVCVESVDIVDVHVPESIQQRVRSIWYAEAESDIIARRGQAETITYTAIESVRKEATAQMLQEFADAINNAPFFGDDETLRAYIALLQRIAEEMNRDRASAYRYFHALEAMSRNPDANVIVSTGDSDLLIDAGHR